MPAYSNRRGDGSQPPAHRLGHGSVHATPEPVHRRAVTGSTPRRSRRWPPRTFLSRLQHRAAGRHRCSGDVLQLGAGPAELPAAAARVLRAARPRLAAPRRTRRGSCSAAPSEGHDRAREQPVQQQELRRAPVATSPPSLRRTARRRRRPAAASPSPARTAGQHPRREQPGGHVDPLEAAAEAQEQPALVPAHGGVGEPGEQRGPLAHPAEEGVRPERAGRAALRAAVPGRVEASHISVEIASRSAAGVLAGGRRARRRPRPGSSRSQASSSITATSRRLAAVASSGSRAHDREQRCGRPRSSVAHGSSSSRCRWTSRMRAVSSARST